MSVFEKGTPFTMKEKNKRLILQCIQDDSPLSRSEIAEKLKISKPTVSSIVEELLQEEWIKEIGAGTAGAQGGRRPIQITFNHQARFVIGVDIGGTKTLAAISDLSGNLLATTLFYTQEEVQCGILHKVNMVAKQMLAELNIDEKKVLGIGIGVPGMTNVKDGIVIDAPSLRWKMHPLKHEAEKIFPWPVFIDNDVNVAVLGEQWLGAAKGMSNVVLISIGTGIGCGMILEGNLYRGSSWAAGEIGYFVTDIQQAKQKDDPIYSGYGFLDRHAGGAGIANKASQALKKQSNHPLQEKAVLTAKDVFDYAKSDDPIALKIIEEVIDHIGFAIANVISIINPEVIILGGGISKSADWYLPRLEEIISQFASVPTEVKRSAFGSEIGVLGAVSLVLRERECVLKTLS